MLQPLRIEALEHAEATLGPDHPDTRTSVDNLAGLLFERRDLHGAELLYRRVLTGCEAKQGTEHPITVAVRDNLAALLEQPGRSGDPPA